MADYAKKFPTDTPLEVLTPSTGVKLNQSTPQSTIGTFTFPNLVVNALEDISVDGMGNINSPPTNNVYKGLLLSNDTPVTSAVRETPPYIIFRGHGWTGSADQITEFALLSDPQNNGNPTFRIFCRETGSGAWTEIWNISSTGQHEFTETWTDYDARETFTLNVGYNNTANSTVDYDQYSLSHLFRGSGWKTAVVANSQPMLLRYALCPEAGVTNPIGVFKYLFGTNTTSSTPETNELLRYEWGDRLGIDFNKLGLANYHFNVTALLAEFGSTPIITTGTFGAGAITGTSFTIGANTLTTSEFAFLDGQDQAVKTSNSPSFVRGTFTEATLSPFAITSTVVNTNLNADLWDGYQFSDYLDQAVKQASSPQFEKVSVNHIGEKTASHTIIMDNNVTIPSTKSLIFSAA